MAYSAPGAPREPRRAFQNARPFKVWSGGKTRRYEEVNNYSRLMTRCFAAWFCRAGGKACQPLTGLQHGPGSMGGQIGKCHRSERAVDTSDNSKRPFEMVRLLATLIGGVL